MVEQTVQSQRRSETMVQLDTAVPDLTFCFIERIVRHDDTAYARDVENLIDVFTQVLRREERARLSQVSGASVETKNIEHGNDPARGFGRGNVIDEQRLPHEIRLVRFRHA